MRKAILPLMVTIIASAFSAPQESIVHRLQTMSDDDVLALARSIVERGVPSGPDGDDLTILARSRSALVLPLLEEKIEEVVKSKTPAAAFTEKNVNPRRVVEALFFTISGAGNQQALREASKLLKLDEKRFDGIVYNIMASAMANERAFTVVYQALDLHDAALDRRIVAWAEESLSQELPKLGVSVYENVRGMRRAWAEALVKRYGDAPTAEQWTNDPLVSRLKPELAGRLYDDVHRFAMEEATKRRRRN